MITERRRNRRAYMFGRRISPLAFWVGYLSLVLTVGVYLDLIVGTNIDSGLGQFIAIPSAAVILLLAYGFWFNKPNMMTHGLLLSTFVWLTVSASSLPETWNMSISGWSSVGLAGLTSWAWWIEVGECSDVEG